MVDGGGSLETPEIGADNAWSTTPITSRGAVR
jgi:hypothetical protein